jgi:hypothetical protein
MLNISAKTNSLTRMTSPKIVVDYIIANVLGFLNNEEANNMRLTCKTYETEVNNTFLLTREKRIVDKSNFKVTLEQYINNRNNQKEKYIFDLKQIQNHLINAPLNDNALVDNDTKQFVVDERMIQTTSDNILYIRSLVQVTLLFLPEQAYTVMESFVDREANEVLNIEYGLLLYNFRNRQFRKTRNIIMSDNILINTNVVYRNGECFIRTKNVVLGPMVTSIGDCAFAECLSLKSIFIPDTVTSIDFGAFATCKRLKSVVIPHSVMSIGSGAFSSCYHLESIVLPDSVTSIGSSSFYKCYNLKCVKLVGGTPSKWKLRLHSQMFEGCTLLINKAEAYGSKSVVDYIVDSHKF